MAFIILLLLVVFVIGFVFVHRRSTELSNICKLYDELVNSQQSESVSEYLNKPVHQQIDQLPYDLAYEIREDRLKIKKVFIAYPLLQLQQFMGKKNCKKSKLALFHSTLEPILRLLVFHPPPPPPLSMGNLYQSI